MEDDSVLPIPNPAVQQQLFVVMRAASTDAMHAEALQRLLSEIDKDGTFRTLARKMTTQQWDRTTRCSLPMLLLPRV